MVDPHDDEEEQVGFLDVAANALAVVIIVTLFAVQALRVQTVWRGDPRATEEPPLPFPMKAAHALGPFTRPWIVGDGWVMPGPQDEAARSMWEGRTLDVGTPQGRVALFSMARRGHDVDLYRASWWPRADGFERRALPDEAAVGAFLDGLETEFRDRHVAPSFLVTAEGMPLFTEIARRLLREPRELCWRWWPLRFDRPYEVHRLRSVRALRC